MTSIIGRAVFTVLLLLAATTPSFAELGCFEDAQAHAQESVSAPVSAVSADTSDSEDKSRPVGTGAHCAFSHCGHGIAGTPADRTAIDDRSNELSYCPLRPDRLDAAPRDGPYHPPRA